jgi:hypothetical protein
MGWTQNDGFGLKVLAWVVIAIFWGITSLMLWFEWNIKRYEVTSDSLIIHTKAGRWGSGQTLYRYESIISVKLTQGFWGKRYNFGDVRLTIPKLDDEVVMHDIENPLDQLMQIQKRMGEHNGSSSLIT